jgi:hypothetical protein
LPSRRSDQSWYSHKDEPAFDDMLAPLPPHNRETQVL